MPLNGQPYGQNYDLLAALALGGQPLGALGQKPSPFQGMAATLAAGQGLAPSPQAQVLAGTDGLGGVNQPTPPAPPVPNISSPGTSVFGTPLPQAPAPAPAPATEAPVAADAAASGFAAMDPAQQFMFNTALQLIFS